jgi:hypothetical protein
MAGQLRWVSQSLNLGLFLSRAQERLWSPGLDTAGMELNRTSWPPQDLLGFWARGKCWQSPWVLISLAGWTLGPCWGQLRLPALPREGKVIALVENWVDTSSACDLKDLNPNVPVSPPQELHRREFPHFKVSWMDAFISLSLSFLICKMGFHSYFSVMLVKWCQLAGTCRI